MMALILKDLPPSTCPTLEGRIQTGGQQFALVGVGVLVGASILVFAQHTWYPGLGVGIYRVSTCIYRYR